MCGKLRRRGAWSDGYTLVELLAAIAIIMLLVSLLLPSLVRAREMMRRIGCQSNARSLAQAAIAYSERFRCLSPIGEPGRAVLWYQKPFLGQFFSEDVPYEPQVDGVVAPPRKSALRCPSEAAWEGSSPLASWIAYNSYMSSEFQPPGSVYDCYWRGPKIEEIHNPGDRFLLFGDGRGHRIRHVSDTWATNDMGETVPESEKGLAMDGRHRGGINVAFLDTHVSFFSDANTAYVERKIHVSTNDPNR